MTHKKTKQTKRHKEIENLHNRKQEDKNKQKFKVKK